jgi:hypothetical protein
MRSINNFVIVIIALTLMFGCSNSSNSSGPPDPSLTYEIVAKNPLEYKGKRVRWVGQCGSGTFKKKGNGSSVENAVFVDPSTNFNVEIRAFSANGESEMDRFSFFGKTFLVTGTIIGTKKIKMTVGGNNETELAVPELRYAKFELSPK